MSAVDLVKPSVRAISAYALPKLEAPVKINQNESPFDLPPAIKKRVVEAVLRRPWSRYPSNAPHDLIARLAAFVPWEPSGILVGNGSNELIQAVLMVTAGRGTRVVMPEPSFGLYSRLARILEAEPIAVPMAEDLSYDAAAFRRRRCETSAPVAIVCTPNNPTGGVFPQAELDALCAEADGLVIVDEAYWEFAGETAVSLLPRHANLVVLRTFSKALSLAGLRVGYLLAAPDLVREIDKARLPFNLNSFSEAAASAAIDAWPELQEQVAWIVAAREALFRRLAEIPGIRPYPSRANFILFDVLDADPRAVFAGLHARGVLVRDVTAYPRLGRCLRATVGSEADNQALVQGLEQVMKRERRSVE